MTEVEAWLTQVDSDFAMASRILDEADPTSYCQVIAKCQQVVEKSTNAIDAVLREQGILLERVRPKHYPLGMINRLTNLSYYKHSDLAANMQRIFHGRWYTDIYDVCHLAPGLPVKGELYQRNTEYPFQNADGTWTAPSAPTSFNLAQVQRFTLVARNLRREAQFIAIAARLNRL